MSDTPEPRTRRGRPAFPRWLLPFLPVGVVLGVLIGLYSTSVPRLFAPRAGPPDTLSATGIALPRATPIVRPRYLERVIAPKSPREIRISELAARYRVTEPLARMIYDAAERERVDPELAFRLIRVESVFDADAVSAGGALGLMQLMPGTARDIDPTADTRKEVLDPHTNLRLGLTNLRNMIERYEGDVRLGVLAYNRGEVAVDRALKRGRDPENGYSVLVLGPRAHGGRSYTGKGLLPEAGASPGAGLDPARR